MVARLQDLGASVTIGFHLFMYGMIT
jgi:hypothetical protein